VAAGRVRVNGRVARLGDRVDPDSDAVEVDGVPVPVRPDLVYYLLNKPRGVLTSASDPRGRPVVVSLVPPEPRVFPVGRLDLDTEGLVILTNDGGLAHRLAHPSGGVEKEYLVEVEPSPSAAAVRRLRAGVELDDGPAVPLRASLAAPGALRLVIHEGRKRQVRRMCAAVGLSVRRLVRCRIGPLSDPRLAPGQWRRLSPGEVRQLAEAAWRAPGGSSPRRNRPH
jgi:23S rRNA pseudouridine2605 synthase